MNPDRPGGFKEHVQVCDLPLLSAGGLWGLHKQGPMCTPVSYSYFITGTPKKDS